jgi:diaminohydroxyphosphoribosylaminopyrimidine deaminase/5-amino-6-(5-phosphoribosylamino)uracil reductase
MEEGVFGGIWRKISDSAKLRGAAPCFEPDYLRYFCAMIDHESYMRRCLQLAELGAGMVAPNPMVGAVLVYNDTVIGEGYHRVYGQAHAEVNCIRDFEERFALGHWNRFGFDQTAALLEQSTLYVSLEPCAHFGKTPPCADMIISRCIPRVVVGIRDPFKEVDGKGIDKLLRAGVDVQVGVLERECRELNKRFFTFHTRRRPYIILKWAQSADGRIGMETGRVAISNDLSNLLVHRWRSEEAAILIGRRTALIDDPALTNRHWPGRPADQPVGRPADQLAGRPADQLTGRSSGSPLRLVLDPSLSLPSHLRLFDGSVPTMIFNTLLQEERPATPGKTAGLHYQRLEGGERLLQEMWTALYKSHIQSVLVEGGARLLQSLLDQGLWDEIRVIRSRSVHLAEGISAPVLPEVSLRQTFDLGDDRFSIYGNPAEGPLTII